MADSPAARFALNDLLRSSAVQKIDFSIGPYAINGPGYLRVAAAVVGRSMGVDVDPKRLAADEGAAYEAPTNELVFRTASLALNTVQRMNVVHECTHALIANRRFRWDGTYTNSEAAAYVAGALYVAYSVSALAREMLSDGSLDF